MDRHALLNWNEGDDGNDAIIEFYAENMSHLMLYPVFSVPNHILRNISVKLHETAMFQSDWRDYATKMGATDHLLLAKIQESARTHHEQELFVTLKSALPQKMLGNIITTLLDSQRYDVLRIIQSDIRELLESNTNTEVKEVTPIHTEFTNITTETNSELFPSVSSLHHSNANNLDTFESFPEILSEHELNNLQQSSTIKDFTTAGKNILISDKPLCDAIPMQVVASTPAEEKLTVFVQHTELDYDIAMELATKLREEEIVVSTLSEMDRLIPMDHAGGALSKMFQKVDFIVPIVSEELLKQIHPMLHDDYLESTDSMNNRWLYQLIMNEYGINRCINFRVRPVIVPKMDRRLLINDIIFSFSFRLWAEVPKLIRILKETKKMMPQYSMINSMTNT